MPTSSETLIAGASRRALSSRQTAFVLITSLFFIWGLSHGLLDVLNKHFQDSLSISHAQSALIQTSYFAAYFFVAVPVGLLIERFGYRTAILVGLGLFAIGALLFLPASWVGTLTPFLMALFVLASGLACLETAANLYAATLGDPTRAEQRLTLAQSFNGLGAFIGPIIGGSVFFLPAFNFAGFSVEPVSLTYLVLAAVVILMMLVFAVSELPEGQTVPKSVDAGALDFTGSLWRKRSFTGALAAQFFFVGNYVGIGAFFINFAIDHWAGMSPRDAAYLLSGGMLAYMVGRFAGIVILRFVPARNLLVLNSVVAAVLCAVAILGVAKISPLAVAAIYLFMSTMYPTIFAMGTRGLGNQTKRAGSILVMTLVGGALLPLLMGLFGDRFGTQWAFIVPLIGFVVIGLYGLSQQPIRFKQS
ncbi:sugar MFS transporter [Pseudomonas putida]